MTQTSTLYSDAMPAVATAMTGTASALRPLRILLVLQSVYPATYGGAESQVRTLARAFKAHGQRVTIVVPRVNYGAQERITRIDGVPVFRLPYLNIPLLNGPFLWVNHARFLIARGHRYDAWHVHIAHHMGAVTAALGRWQSKPVVLKVAGSWELERGTLSSSIKPWTWIAYRFLLLADKWQATSQRMATTLAGKGVPASRIVVLPNAVETSRFRNIKRAPQGAPRFIFIGRLVRQKALETLLDAFAATLPAHPGATLLVVGTGPLLDELKAQASRLGLDASVTFTGHRNDIEVVLADANIGVLSSRIEGLSNTLLESMAAGLPMVASRISGNEDFVRTGENGWLFEPGDREGLARCLDAAASLSPAQRTAMGECARDTVEQQAGVDSVINRLMALYRGSAAMHAANGLAGRKS